MPRSTGSASPCTSTAKCGVSPLSRRNPVDWARATGSLRPLEARAALPGYAAIRSSSAGSDKATALDTTYKLDLSPIPSDSKPDAISLVQLFQYCHQSWMWLFPPIVHLLVSVYFIFNQDGYALWQFFFYTKDKKYRKPPIIFCYTWRFCFVWFFIYFSPSFMLPKRLKQELGFLWSLHPVWMQAFLVDYTLEWEDAYAIIMLFTWGGILGLERAVRMLACQVIGYYVPITEIKTSSTMDELPSRIPWWCWCFFYQIQGIRILFDKKLILKFKSRKSKEWFPKVFF